MKFNDLNREDLTKQTEVTSAFLSEDLAENMQSPLIVTRMEHNNLSPGNQTDKISSIAPHLKYLVEDIQRSSTYSDMKYNSLNDEDLTKQSSSTSSSITTHFAENTLESSTVSDIKYELNFENLIKKHYIHFRRYHRTCTGIINCVDMKYNDLNPLNLTK